jgi:hypothetical protein
MSQSPGGTTQAPAHTEAVFAPCTKFESVARPAPPIAETTPPATALRRYPLSRRPHQLPKIAPSIGAPFAQSQHPPEIFRRFQIIGGARARRAANCSPRFCTLCIAIGDLPAPPGKLKTKKPLHQPETRLPSGGYPTHAHAPRLLPTHHLRPHRFRDIANPDQTHPEVFGSMQTQHQQRISAERFAMSCPPSDVRTDRASNSSTRRSTA